jgi:hypothetical protein
MLLDLMMMSGRLEIRYSGPVGFLRQFNSSSRPFIAFLEADDLNLDVGPVIQVTMRATRQRPPLVARYASRHDQMLGQTMLDGLGHGIALESLATLEASASRKT